GRSLEPFGANRAFVDRTVEESELAILHVLDRLGIDRRPLALNFRRWCRWRRWCWCSIHRRRRREEPAGTRRVGFFGDALLLGINALRSAFLENWAPEVTG